MIYIVTTLSRNAPSMGPTNVKTRPNENQNGYFASPENRERVKTAKLRHTCTSWRQRR